jgi:hypothetical protein
MENEMYRACGKHGEKKNMYSILIIKLEGNRPTGRPGNRWEDNIKLAVYIIRCEDLV